jgi:hypothetical protein
LPFTRSRAASRRRSARSGMRRRDRRWQRFRRPN